MSTKALATSLGKRPRHSCRVTVVIHIARCIWRSFLSLQALELSIHLVSLNSSHGLRAHTLEIVIVACLEGAPALWGVHVIPEVGHDVILREVDKHGLIVHHRPVAWCKSLTPHWSGASVVFIKSYTENVSLVGELKAVVVFYYLKSMEWCLSEFGFITYLLGSSWEQTCSLLKRSGRVARSVISNSQSPITRSS